MSEKNRPPFCRGRTDVVSRVEPTVIQRYFSLPTRCRRVTYTGSLRTYPDERVFMPTALYPGTFDPITNGHVDIAIRAARIFRHVIVVVGENLTKKTLFTAGERVAMARDILKENKRIKVIRYDGLIVNCLREYKATALIRGLRALSDFDYEFQMAFTNRNMNARAETVFLMPSSEYTYLNSTLVKQIANHGGDIESFVPPLVQKRLMAKISRKRSTSSQ